KIDIDLREMENPNLNLFIIYNNLIRESEYILIAPDPEKFSDTSRKIISSELLLFTKMESKDVEETISLNADNFSVKPIEKEYFFSESAADKKKSDEKIGNDGKEQGDKAADLIEILEIEKPLVDTIIGLLGEYLVDITQLHAFFSEFKDKIYNKLDDEETDQIGELDTLITSALMKNNSLFDFTMKMRLLPFSRILLKLPRLIRELGRKTGKKIDLIHTGGAVRMGPEIIEALNAPIIHLIRNSADHGIELPEERVKKGKPETGKIEISAEYVNNRIILKISDDGKGIDYKKILKLSVEKNLITSDEAASLGEDEAIQLIFKPGFSTKKETSDLSGRGVGLDVVRENLKSIRGKVKISTEMGKGTEFILSFPIMK
ncbi:MAG: hypothetical protein KAS39_01680, partial [Actinomycetia bacterium]|nr:hypothetical protein [Actinomycetes bacterium]